MSGMDWKSGSGASLRDVVRDAEGWKAEAARLARAAAEVSRQLKLAGSQAQRCGAQDAADGAFAAARDAKAAATALWGVAERYATAARSLGRVMAFLDGAGGGGKGTSRA